MLSSIDQLTTVVSGAPMPFLQKMEPVTSSLYFHLVLRIDGAALGADQEEQMRKYFVCFTRKRGGRLITAAFARNRVHLLIALSPFCALGTFIRELKLFSATFAQRKLEAEDFGWREKYEAFTVSLSQIERVCSYISRQKFLDRQESYAASWNRLASQELY